MEVLIIGGSGILSSAVVNECIYQGIRVSMINRGTKSAFINPGAELIKCNAYDTNKVSKLLKGRHFDAVIDFLVLKEEDVKRSLSLFGTITNQYVFISSAQVYNTTFENILTENSKLGQNLWAYSINKLICEQTIQKYCSSHNVPYTIIRPGVNYGPTRIPYGMHPNIGQHWTLISRIQAGKPIITWNEGKNRLNLTRVEDFASGTVGLLGNSKALNEVFNVVGDYVYSWSDVLQTLSKIIGEKIHTIDIPIEFYANELNGDAREELLGGRSKNLICSNEKLKKAVPNFKTKYNLEDGLVQTLDFYKKNNFYQGFDYTWDGNIDRIITKYSRTQKFNIDDVCKFVSYEESAQKNYRVNKYQYKAAFYKYNLFQRFISSLIR